MKEKWENAGKRQEKLAPTSFMTVTTPWPIIWGVLALIKVSGAGCTSVIFYSVEANFT